ncbi:MAG: hypothetical protein L7F77_09350 [Candidatus Magnetominusculus sp. LBB02]|nr:hypothetical protein [Candidatus Magnetominusculus sp. LBB02]
MLQKVKRSGGDTQLIERAQVLEELQDSYARLSGNAYADMPEAELLEMLNEARRKYREETLPKVPAQPAF